MPRGANSCHSRSSAYEKKQDHARFFVDEEKPCGVVLLDEVPCCLAPKVDVEHVPWVVGAVLAELGDKEPPVGELASRWVLEKCAVLLLAQAHPVLPRRVACGFWLVVS